MIYNEIYNFCKVRDEDRKKYSNRAKFLDNLLTRLGIEHKIVRTKSKRYKKYFYNIYCFGSSDKFLSAHYDIVDIKADNANDNSASVINCIAYKLKNPSINLLILDGEEPPFMGVGSNLAAKYLKINNIPVKWIFNLELTGTGNTFFIDDIPTPLSACIQKHFPEAFVTATPFNDAAIFRQHGLVSNVVTVVNSKEETFPITPINMRFGEWVDEIESILQVNFTEELENYDINDILYNNWRNSITPEETAEDILILMNEIKEKSQFPEIETETRKVADMAPLYISHSPKDSVDKMSTDDMRNFVDNVVDVIVKKC